MQNSNITVDIQQLASLSASIQQSNNRMNGILRSIINDMQLIQEAWDSEAATAFLDFLRPIKDNMVTSSDYLAEYAKFLDQTVLTYEECEKKIQNVTSAFSVFN